MLYSITNIRPEDSFRILKQMQSILKRNYIYMHIFLYRDNKYLFKQNYHVVNIGGGILQIEFNSTTDND